MARSEIETGAVWVNTSHPSPAQKPPTSEAGVIGWLRSNLFSSVFNSILTVLSAIALYYIIGGFVRWVFFDAFWEPVWVNRKLITVGTYPAAQLWQPATLLAIVSVLFGLSGGRWGGIMRSLTMGVAALLLLFAVLPVGMQAQIYLGIGLALLLVSYVIGLRVAVPARWLMIGWFLSIPVALILLKGGAEVRSLGYGYFLRRRCRQAPTVGCCSPSC
ncbi:MAG: hypothetical protein R2873_06915 [Caldilineaceae bacterium]